MIDLRKEIKNLKENITLGSEYADGCIDTIDDILKNLDNCNLITTPKSLNLSTIIDKLNKTDENNKFKATIKVGGFVVVENTEFEKEYFYIKDDKIFDLSTYMVKPENKWLFNLWTTNTKIIDDMESDDNVKD